MEALPDTCSNPVTNKFTNFQEIKIWSVDAVSVAEPKIDVSFPSAQFVFAGYHLLYRLDVSSRSEGGILIHVKSSIPSRRLPCGKLNYSVHTNPFKINLRKEKWLVISIYRPLSQNSEFSLNNLTKIIDNFAKYDNYLIMGNFYMEPSDSFLTEFLAATIYLNQEQYMFSRQKPLYWPYSCLQKIFIWVYSLIWDRH